MNKEVIDTAKEAARQLRKRLTAVERIMWTKLRNKMFLRKKFLRQHPIFCEYAGKTTFFISDFYCHEHRLVIEVDGKSHDSQKEYDELRTFLINTKGIRVVRFKNEEIEHDLPAVLEHLRKILAD